MKLDINREILELILEKMLTEESCLRIENYSISIINIDSDGELKNYKIIVFIDGHKLGLYDKEIIIRKNVLDNIYNTLLSCYCEKIKIDMVMNSIDFCTEDNEVKISSMFKVTTYGNDEHRKFIFYSL